MVKHINPFRARKDLLFTRRNTSARAIIEQIPEGGCLLIFNDTINRWKPVANRMGFTVFTLDGFQANQKVRDFWIGKWTVADDTEYNHGCKMDAG